MGSSRKEPTFTVRNNTVVQVDEVRPLDFALLLHYYFRKQDVFPGAFEAKIPLEAGPLLSAVEQASIVTNEESRGVDFTFADGLLKLSSRAADIGSSHVELPIHYEGKAIEITFDPRYLTDALKTLDDDAPLVAELIDHKSAAVFKTEDQYTYVVMPLTRDR